MTLEPSHPENDRKMLMPDEDPKPLKPARSQAELIRTRNSNILVCIAIASWLTNTLVALKVFGIL